MVNSDGTYREGEEVVIKEFQTSYLFNKENMSHWKGKVMTIKSFDGFLYKMLEDQHEYNGSGWNWYSDMIDHVATAEFNKSRKEDAVFSVKDEITWKMLEVGDSVFIKGKEQPVVISKKDGDWARYGDALINKVKVDYKRTIEGAIVKEFKRIHPRVKWVYLNECKKGIFTTIVLDNNTSGVIKLYKDDSDDKWLAMLYAYQKAMLKDYSKLLD